MKLISPNTTIFGRAFHFETTNCYWRNYFLHNFWSLWFSVASRPRYWSICIFRYICSCRTSQYRRSFVPLSVSLWNDLSDPVFDGVGLAGFKSRANAFLLAWSALSFLSPTVLSFSSFHGLIVSGWDLWTDRVFSLSPGLAQRTPKE